MMGTILKKVIKLFDDSRFIFRNLWFASRLPKIAETSLEVGYHLAPCERGRFEAFLKLYADLTSGHKLPWSRRVVYWLIGNRLCVLLLEEDSGQAVGVMMGYFNARDIKEQSIHIGYTGIVPEFRGKGLSYHLRYFTYTHFARAQWLTDVSSRITLANEASLRGAQKMGYTIRERYYDNFLGVERAYLICGLEAYRNN